MKPTHDEMRATLGGDSTQLLVNTYNEYVDDPAKELKLTKKLDREQLITDILALMVKAGDIHPISNIFKLSDLSRELGVDPKVARDKIRRAAAAGKTVPTSVKGTGWSFNVTDRDTVAEIIRLKKPKS